jgi:hypothetical protein
MFLKKKINSGKETLQEHVDNVHLCYVKQQIRQKAKGNQGV